MCPALQGYPDPLGRWSDRPVLGRSQEIPILGIHRFRPELAEYIDADMPVIVTCHDEAMGLFVPLRRLAPTTCGACVSR